MPKKITINNQSLAKNIIKKFDEKLTYKTVNIAIDVIVESIIESLMNDEAISIENFGSLSPFMFHKHMGVNIRSGELQEVPAFRSVKLRPHVALEDLLAARRSDFEKPIV